MHPLEPKQHFNPGVILWQHCIQSSTNLGSQPGFAKKSRIAKVVNSTFDQTWIQDTQLPLFDQSWVQDTIYWIQDSPSHEPTLDPNM